MDILISSNFERYLYDITSNHDVVENYMKHLIKIGQIEIKELHHRHDFYPSTATDEETINMIKTVKQKYNYLIDPHTAVAYKAFIDYSLEHNDYDRHTLIVSTASPFKFSNTVIKSINPSKMDHLDDEISTIKEIAPSMDDQRVNLVLKEHINEMLYTINEAKEKIKKVLGDLDADY
jgi:threonine synthase